MPEAIVKRDGRVVPFDPARIESAVLRAFQATGEAGDEAPRRAQEVTAQVVARLEDVRVPHIEQVQDLVEEALMRAGWCRTAKAYILYREQRRQVREMRSLVSSDLIDSYLAEADWRVRENANVGFSLQGLNVYLTGAMAAEYWLQRVYPPEVREAHKNGDLHLHDLAFLANYCCGWDLQALLREGFGGVPGHAEASPPKHFRSALGQVYNFLYTLQGEAAGAQAFSSFDTLLAPYVRADGLTYEEVRQALQEAVFNLNTPTRVGAQCPFTNVTLDLFSSAYDREPAFVDGREMPWTYGELQEERLMIARAFCEVMLRGDASGRGFTFPVPTFNVTREWAVRDVPEVFRLAAKYGSPYFANFVSSDLSPDDVRSMCPMHPDTEVVVRSKKGIQIRRIVDVYNTAQRGTEYEALHNGRWVRAKAVALPTVGCVKLTIANGVQVVFDVRHEQPVKLGPHQPVVVLAARDIRPGMWLPFNSVPVTEENENYEAGYAVGAYLGDGSREHSGDQASGAIIYSLNDGKKQAVAERLRRFFSHAGFTCSERHDSHVVFLRIGSAGNAAQSWIEQFVVGESASEKRLTARAFQMGRAFLQGILDGWYATDGGNRGRIYTSSPHLVRDFQRICGMLGLAYKIGEPDERPGRFSTTKVWMLKFHTRPCYGSHYFFEDGYHWFPVAAVERVDHSGMVYCLTVESDDHLFQLASGLVTHNCRLRLDKRELLRRGGGLFGANPMTGSVGVVTLNLPRLAYLSSDEDDFFRRLAQLAGIAVTALEVKRKALDRFAEAGLYPFTARWLKPVKERFGSYFANHFSTIGVVGGNEMCLNLLGVPITDPAGKAFAVKVLQFLREFCASAQERTGHLYNLEATPAEGCSHRLARIDKAKYPDIVVANEAEWKKGAAPYYTNSTHPPVGWTDDPLEVLEHQEDLQVLYTGGTVVHFWLGEALPDPEACREFVLRVCEGSRVPYITLTPTYSVCPEHGYLPGEQPSCPRCGAATEVWSRVTGYYRPVSAYNAGKQAEFRDRASFRIGRAA